MDLSIIDDLSQKMYDDLLKQQDGRDRKSTKKKRAFLVKKMVSQNRKRFRDEEFDLDLTLITERTFAMGFPGEGIKNLYRNSLNDVISYFAKYHNGKVKIYNLCNDDFINYNKTSFDIDKNLKKMHKLRESSVPVAYFPMMDHNPAPLKMLFYLCLDSLTYLC
jgi:phosphatidylinositol-3,4,5-trisphosphate 3-phosphatase/dual-specificity protein phosphatase PTEN